MQRVQVLYYLHFEQHLAICKAWAPSTQVRAHNAQLIQRAYSSVEQSKAAALLGLPEAQAVESAHPRVYGCQAPPRQLTYVDR